MSNVTQFPVPEAKEPAIWICSCGCQSFRLQSDGVIECCVCLNTICDHGEWRKTLPDCPDDIDKTDEGSTIVAAVGDVSLARRRVIKQIEDWAKADQLAFLCAYSAEGGGKHWFDIEDDESKAWIVSRMREMLASVEETIIPQDKTP